METDGPRARDVPKRYRQERHWLTRPPGPGPFSSQSRWAHSNPFDDATIHQRDHQPTNLAFALVSHYHQITFSGLPIVVGQHVTIHPVYSELPYHNQRRNRRTSRLGRN